MPTLSCRTPPQRRIAAREEASLQREKATLQHAQELEGRVAALDSKEKKLLRVGGREGRAGGWVGGWVQESNRRAAGGALSSVRATALVRDRWSRSLSVVQRAARL